MIPLKLTDATRSMTPPGEWDQSKGVCLTLDINDGQDHQGKFMTSAWQLEDGELRKLRDGAPIFLRIYGTAHPVVCLYVGNPEDLQEVPVVKQ